VQSQPSLPKVPYVAIYRLNLPPPSETLVVLKDRDFRITLQPGPFRFTHTIQHLNFEPPSTWTSYEDREVQMPKGSYAVIQVLMDFASDMERERIGLLVAEAASLIELRCSGTLGYKAFEGVVNTQNTRAWWPEGPIKLIARPAESSEEVAKNLENVFVRVKGIDSRERSRLQLAARWFRRGHEASNEIDKFLFLWTALEVYPGKGNTDIVKNVSEVVAALAGSAVTVQEVKAQLEIGRLYGKRSEIVHKGQAFVEEERREAFEKQLEKLHSIVVACLRSLAGIDIGHDLLRFLKH